MEESAVRRRTASTYAWLMAVTASFVVVQGTLFAAFYSERDGGYIEAHGIVGSLVGMVLLVVLVPLGFLGRFPGGQRMGWWTVLLAVLWNVQAHIFGYGIADTRWFEIVHIPLAFGILALGAYLAFRAFRVLGATS